MADQDEPQAQSPAAAAAAAVPVVPAALLDPGRERELFQIIENLTEEQKINTFRGMFRGLSPG
jgi:hypothetical protein